MCENIFYVMIAQVPLLLF